MDTLARRMSKFLKGESEGKDEEEMEAVLQTVNDMNTLIDFRDRTTTKLKPRKLVEARMTKILSEVRKGETPEWFLLLIENPVEIPVYLKLSFVHKVKELEAES
jgi:hypothetical protein